MRRIYIEKEDEGVAKEYKDLIDNNKTRKINKLNNLANVLNKNPSYKKYANYLEEIAKNFDEIIFLVPEGLDVFLSNHTSLDLNETELKEELEIDEQDLEGDSDSRGDDDGFTENIDSSNQNNSASSSKKKFVFWERVTEIMGYDGVRNKVIVPFIKKLNIRTCVYCNAEYLSYAKKIVEIKNKKKIAKVKKMEVTIGRFQVDHFMPQSRYPFLCISFYNFQPSCGYCNLWKSDKSIKFNLYTQKKECVNPFLINLNVSSIKEYADTHDAEKLKIEIKTPQEPDLIVNHDEVFMVNELYKSYLDEAEEVVWMGLACNKSYVEQLKATYKDIFGDDEKYLERFLYGFYKEEKNIHIRPLTKMKQDIFKQMRDMAPKLYEMFGVTGNV